MIDSNTLADKTLESTYRIIPGDTLKKSASVVPQASISKGQILKNAIQNEMANMVVIEK